METISVMVCTGIGIVMITLLYFMAKSDIG